MDFLLSAYQKLYSALQSLERFSIGQDLFDNIVCIDNFLSEFRNVTFVLQKAVAHTDYELIYKELCEKYLKNPQCLWLVTKRNKVLKESPFSLEKKMVLKIYSPNMTRTFHSESYTIADEVNYESLINMVEETISNIPAIEVFFSTEFIYNEVGENQNLFTTIDCCIVSLLSMLEELDKKIGIKPSQSRNAIMKKINSLQFYRILTSTWFIEDYVYYSKDKSFEKGIRLENLTSTPITIKHSTFCKCQHIDITDNFINDTFLAFIKLHTKCFYLQKSIMPTFLILKKNGELSLNAYQASIKTTTYRKIYEIASLIKLDPDIVAVFIVNEMIYNNNLELLNVDYRFRIKNANFEMLSFNKITKEETKQYFINSEAILYNSEDCLFPNLTEVKINNLSYISPIIAAFSRHN